MGYPNCSEPPTEPDVFQRMIDAYIEREEERKRNPPFTQMPFQNLKTVTLSPKQPQTPPPRRRIITIK